MAIEGVAATTNQSTAIGSLTQKTVTQDDFLKLLIAQLQNQDPLEPMDNQQFAAQLAQFNSLGQLIEINSKLGGLQGGQGSMNQYNAAALIGKEIVSTGNQINLSSGSSSTVGFKLAGNAAKVTVDIVDASGKLVRRIEVGARNAGDQSVLWDGKDSAGRSLAPGVYGFAIGAANGAGQTISATGKLQGVVTGVKLDGSEPVLEVGGIEVPLSGVSTVRAAR